MTVRPWGTRSWNSWKRRGTRLIACARLLYSRQNPQLPLAVLSGDTLFIGSVGRPDLLGEGMSAATLASMMFDTWTKKLSKLPDSVMIFPAHGRALCAGPI